jgi:hypothetical protein
MSRGRWMERRMGGMGRRTRRRLRNFDSLFLHHQFDDQLIDIIARDYLFSSLEVLDTRLVVRVERGTGVLDARRPYQMGDD